MSKASRKWKEQLKRDNRDSAIFCPSFKRMSRRLMTLKAYKKLARDLKRYCRGTSKWANQVDGGKIGIKPLTGKIVV